MAEGCCPSREGICDACLADAFAQLRGVAESRGWQWAGEQLEHVRGTWPTDSLVIATLALIRVRDLGRDRRLLEKLARVCEQAAARRWREATTAGGTAATR